MDEKKKQLMFFKTTGEKELPYDPESDTYSIDQYEDWFVRVVSDISSTETPSLEPANKVIPKIIVDGKLLDFVWIDGKGYYRLPNQLLKSPYNSGTTGAWNLKSQAGMLTLYSDYGQPLHPSLYIKPPLSAQEFAAILKRLGELALAEMNGLVAPTFATSPNPEKTLKGDYPTHFATQLELYLRLVRVIDDQWEAIKAGSAKTLHKDLKLIDTSKPIHQQKQSELTSGSQRPGQIRIPAQTTQENDNTVENIFLAHVLRNVMKEQAGPLASRIRQTEAWFRSVARTVEVKDDTYSALFREHQEAALAEANHLEKLATLIDECAERAARYLREDFLGGVSGSYKNGENQIKLQRSTHYGPVYQSYLEYQENREKLTTPSKVALLRGLEERKIKPVSELFEIWAFVEVHQMLIDHFGFTQDGSGPVFSLNVIAGELVLKPRSKFTLRFISKNKKGNKESITIELEYIPSITPRKCEAGKACYSEECSKLGLFCYNKINVSRHWMHGEDGGLTPDIVMTVHYGNNEEKKFVMDAKYRNYKTQGLERGAENYGVTDLFEMDLLGTAKMKYLDGLGTHGAFIIHSDALVESGKQKYTLFGSEPFPWPPQREKKLGETYYPAHRVGAICLRPNRSENAGNQLNGLDNLEKLIRMILMYHCGLEQICWRCGNELNPDTELAEKQGIVGNGYYCPDCKKSWIVEICNDDKNHHIFHLGPRDSFHKVNETSGEKGRYICPGVHSKKSAS